jgi:CubicO group peptidase (beta-lactamase class C family)
MTQGAASFTPCAIPCPHEQSPQALGVDSAQLEAAIAYLGQHLDVSSVSVARRGYLIRKGPGANDFFSTYSVTKSFRSTVLGLLVDQGMASLDTLAAS